MRGDGAFKVRGNKIHVHGSVDGVFYRKSTGKKVSAITKEWMTNADPIEVLSKIVKKEIDETLLHSNMSLEEFGLEVLELTSSRRNQFSQADVVGLFKNRILPVFRHYRFRDIKPLDLVKFLEAQKKEINNDRVRKIKNTFGLILAYAEDNELIDKNPMNAKTVERVDLTYTPVRTEAYTTDEVYLMLKSAKGWFKVFLELSLKLGLRSGEAMGIKWKDIDLKTGVFTLQRSITKGVITEETEDSVKEKNKKHYRVLQLFPETVALLKSYYNVRLSDEWLFINKDGTYFKESKTIIDYHLKPLLKDVGVKYRTLYATRRSYASIMHYGGENMSDLQQAMGHSEGSAITEKHYIDPRMLNQQQNALRAKNSEELFNAMLGVSGESMALREA